MNELMSLSETVKRVKSWMSNPSHINKWIKVIYIHLSN